jgi:protein-ribulosamine 3-kinase
MAGPGRQGQRLGPGPALANLHRTTWRHFGWRRDNTIGGTPQPNPATADWPTFYGEHRLGHQLRLARRNGAPGRLVDGGERLVAGLAAFFTDHRPVPSLLHGDLWGGNYGYAEGQPVLFDPAVYYGDREADLAMTELFGGFPPTSRPPTGRPGPWIRVIPPASPSTTFITSSTISICSAAAMPARPGT